VSSLFSEALTSGIEEHVIEQVNVRI